MGHATLIRAKQNEQLTAAIPTYWLRLKMLRWQKQNMPAEQEAMINNARVEGMENQNKTINKKF